MNYKVFKNRFLELCEWNGVNVDQMCKKYHYTPMMWSDMFYSFASGTHTYRDPDVRIPANMVLSLFMMANMI